MRGAGRVMRGLGSGVGKESTSPAAGRPFATCSSRCRGARLGVRREVRADALLEPERGLAAQPELGGRAADGAGMKVGNLEEDCAGRLGDLAIASPHDAGDRHGPFPVADHEHVGVEVALDLIEGCEGLAGTRPSGADLGAAHEVVVEGVERLTRLEHDVVGDVDDVVDGAHAGADEALLHPRGRRPQLDPLDDAGGEAPAEIGGFDRDGDEVAGLLPGLGVRAIRFAQGPAGDGRHLAGEAEHAEQVGAVGPGGDIEDDVADGIDEGCADGGVPGQHEDALVVVAQAELLLAEDHAGGVDAPDGAKLQLGELAAVAIDEHRAFGRERDPLAGGDVGRAADHRLRPVPHLHGSEHQAVGIGMGIDGEHFGHANELRIPLLADYLPALDLGDGIGDALRELRGREVNVDVVAQPGKRNLQDWLLAVGCWLLGVRFWLGLAPAEKC